VPQIAFEPDWTKHAQAASFKRDGAPCSPSSCRSASRCSRAPGIQANLADKVKKLDIPVWTFGDHGA
jgi:hypothetical protein